MPIYAYKCESCGVSKDVLQKMSDDPLTVCPACGKSSFQKQLTAAGFQLKGSGWYATDFKGGASPTTAAPAEAGKADGSAPAPAESKTDAAPAPAAKTESAPSASAGSCGPSCACH